jgi:hypothetical protein
VTLCPLASGSWCFEDHVTFIFNGNYSMKNARGNGGRRKLHNEELNDLYSSLNIIQVIKLRKMGWAGM